MKAERNEIHFHISMLTMVTANSGCPIFVD